jgi:DNA invertase Pin-like site-specific DNA recombinase
MEGIAKAKAAGVYTGRKASIDTAAIHAALNAGEKPAHVAKRLGIARSSVYRLMEPEPA